MAPRSGDPGAGPERRFFLGRTPDEGRAELLPSELGHARRVLRLAVGDRLIGLDGRGSAWPLRVGALTQDSIGLDADGPVRREPAPGEPGAALPWIEVAVAWPKPARAEEMVDRLTQLGAAAIAPIVADRSAPGARDLSRNRLDRLQRVAREACKQCGRAWLPVLHPARTIGELAGGETVVLQPGAPEGLGRWALATSPADRAKWTSAHPLRIVVGPEGGLAPEEERALLARGAAAASLGPHIQRIETAAEAALAILVDALFRRSRT